MVPALRAKWRLAGTTGSRRHVRRIRKVPIELARLGIKRPRLQRAVVDPDHWRDLGEIAGRKNLVGAKEILVAQRALDHGDAVGTEQLDHPPPGDAVQKRAVRRR